MAGWRRADAGQKENSLQLVMLCWQARYNTDAQHMTIDTQRADGNEEQTAAERRFWHRAEADRHR